MSRQTVVAHVTKYTSSSFSSGGLGRHIDRKHVPDNAREEDQDKNFSLVHLEQKSIREKIDERIEQGYSGTKAIRKDAVRSCGVIFSGSHEQMKKIEDADLIEEWAKNTYDFACDRWGKDNIVRAAVHMDEKTPHMHLHFVPLTSDGRLSAKEIISKKELKSLQNDYANIMQEYGLERGLEGSKQRHITTRQYYQKVSEVNRDAQSIMQHPESKELVQMLLLENQKLKREQELKEAQEQGRKESLKNNPDKANSYANPTRQAQSKAKQSRPDIENERGYEGPSL